MKKVVKLISGLSALLLLTFVSCDNAAEEIIPKAVAEKVSVATVEVPAEVIALVANNEVTVVSEENKADVEAELKDSLSAEALSEMLNSFATNKDEIVESARDVSVEDLDGLLNEFSEKLEAYNNALLEKGNASMNFSKTPGTVTGMPEGIELNIPVVFVDMKSAVAASQTKTSRSQSLVLATGASTSVDFAKVEGFEDFLFKNAKANLAINGGYAVKLTVDMSNFNPETFDPSNIDTETFDPSSLYTQTYTGNLNYDCNFSVGGVFVTKNNVAGKLLATADIKVKLDDLSSFNSLTMGETLSQENINSILDAYAKATTINFKVAAYDFEGNEVFSLIDSNDVDEISDYVELEVLLEQFMSKPDYE